MQNVFAWNCYFYFLSLSLFCCYAIGHTHYHRTWQINKSAHTINCECLIVAPMPKLRTCDLWWMQVELSLLIIYVFWLAPPCSLHRWIHFSSSLSNFYRNIWLSWHDSNETSKKNPSILDDVMAKWCLDLSLFEFDFKMWMNRSHVVQFLSECHFFSNRSFCEQEVLILPVKTSSHWIYIHFYLIRWINLFEFCCCWQRWSRIDSWFQLGKPLNYFWK